MRFRDYYLIEAVAKSVSVAKSLPKYKDIPEEIFDSISSSGLVKIDGGTYIEWVLNRYLKMDSPSKKRFKEDISQITNGLKEFAERKNKGYWKDPKDINQYKTIADLYSILRKYEGMKSKNDLKVSSKDVSEEDIETLYDDGTWTIKTPKTKEASCILGRGTHWCTASQGENNMFDFYTKEEYPDSKLYVISNGKDKWQAHPESNQFMDVNDREVNPLELDLPKGIIKFLLDVGLLLNYTIQTDNLEMVKYLVSLGAKPNEDSLDQAIYTNNLEMVKYVVSLGAKPSAGSLYNAIDANNLEMVKYVVSLGAKPNEDSLDQAIYTNNLEMVKYVVSLGAKPSVDSLGRAIYTNNPEIVKLVVSLGVKPNLNTLDSAYRMTNPEIISYIKELILAQNKNESLYIQVGKYL